MTAQGHFVPVCHDREFVFIHIPRCGGTSIEASLSLFTRDALYGVERHGDRILTLHHLTASDIIEAGLLSAELVERYFKFTVIRPPFERMASDYYWQQRHDCHGEFRGLSFGAYLDKAEAVIRREGYFEKVHYDHFRPMADYCLSEGCLAVDDILLLGNIDDDLERLAPILGDLQLPHLNHVRDYSELRTPENVQRVEQIYACDKLLYDSIPALLGQD